MKQHISRFFHAQRANFRIRYIVAMLPASIFITIAAYKQIHFGSSQIDEIIFYFQNGLSEGNAGSMQDAGLSLIPWVLIVSLGLALPLVFLPRWRRWYAAAITLASAITLLYSFSVPQYVKALSQSSQLYEQHYVDPRTAHLTFPEHKRNLIHIYVESLENTVLSTQAGGQADVSLIPELEALATQHTSFSHTARGLGGAQQVTGTGWTVAGMTAQSAGVPLKTGLLGKDHNSYGYYKQFLPGAYSLGDILQKAGYQQSFLMGSGAFFGGRDKLLQQHGNYRIIDHNHQKETGVLPNDYLVWWGYEDSKLFDYAKQEATRLARDGKPFNLQMLTANTHFTDGYLEQHCPTPHQHKYDNVHACSSRQITEFVAWVQSQPFGANTTIVITGDHLGMQSSYYQAKINQPGYQRTIFNTFINPAHKAPTTASRQFTAFDIYPTTLAALGASIQGDRLALGTNLFSGRRTLLEEAGSVQAFDDELRKRSQYYERRIMLDSSTGR